MKSHTVAILAAASLFAGSLAAQAEAKGSDKDSKPKAAAQPEKKKVKLVEGPEGLRLGLTSESIAKLYDRVFTEEYLPRYKKVSPGPRMEALELELEDRKAELRRRTEFGSVPVALESSPLKNEFSYGNRESMTQISLKRTVMSDDLKQQREVGYHRYFFFFSDKSWKIYDEYKLGKKGLHSTFKDGILGLSAQLGSKPQMLKADPSSKRDYEAAVWVEGETVVQLLNREEEDTLAIVYIQKAVLDKLDHFRPNKPEAEAVSSEVMDVTSKPSGKSDSKQSPADAYIRKRRK